MGKSFNDYLADAENMLALTLNEAEELSLSDYGLVLDFLTDCAKKYDRSAQVAGVNKKTIRVRFGSVTYLFNVSRNQQGFIFILTKNPNSAPNPDRSNSFAVSKFLQSKGKDYQIFANALEKVFHLK